MKKRFLFLVCLFSGLLPCSIWQSGCTTGTPTSSTANPTPTPYGYGYGTVIVNDQATGSCPIHVWLDATGPITISGGTIQTFSNVLYGSHTLVFNTTASVTCSGPVSCLFDYSSATGVSCSFNLSANQSKTAAITDNGCAQLTVTCPW